MRVLWIAATLVAIGGVARPLTARVAETPRATAIDQSPFTVPAGLRPQVEFWKKIFATYSIHQVVVHDAEHLDRVYKVLDFRPLIAAGMSDVEVELAKRRTVEAEVAKIAATLSRLDHLGPDPQGLSGEEAAFRALFRRDKDPHALAHAATADRLRTQSGLRERFARGLEVAARYLPEIERVFRDEGVPQELTRLPLIESCFNVRAYSKVGAAGAWQFMRSTGRRFMRIDDAVDERRDPVVAARAAARYVRNDYEGLGTWPLAITAYNHGRAGMMRAVETIGSTDIVDIVRRYHGPAFKFASRNFYAEFLAALDVERNAATYFGDLGYEAPQTSATVRIPDYVKLSALASCAETAVDTLVDLNPALTNDVIDGKLRVPRGYLLRVPAGREARFPQRYAALPAQQKASSQACTYLVHRVQRGQSLVAIARKYGTTVAAIQRHNNLSRRTAIRAGQTLQIPRSST